MSDRLRNISIFLCVALVVLIIWGCSDKPEREASKELRSETSKALLESQREDDYEKIRKDLRVALGRNSAAGSGADGARLVSGDLAFEQAQQILLGLDDYTRQIDDLAGIISSATRELNYLVIEQGLTEGLLLSTDSEIAELEKVIEGDGASGGMQQQLGQLNAQLVSLEREKQKYAEQVQQAQDSANSIQQQADEKFRQAEQATGEQKVKLEKEGYALLLAKDVIEAQDALDKIEVIDNKIATIKPLADKIMEDLGAIEDRIEAIKNGAERNELKAHLSSIKRQIAESNQNISNLIVQLDTSQDAYQDQIDSALELLEQSVKDYKGIKTKTSRDEVSARMAESYFWGGTIAVKNVRNQKYFVSRINSIALAAEGAAASALGAMSQKYTQAAGEYAQKAMENFDLCLGEYDKIKNTASKVSDEFAAAVKNAQLLALYSKINLADLMGDIDTAASTLTQAEEIMAKMRESDANFDKSIVARLFSGDVTYVPNLVVDRSAYYEGLKKQMAGWDRLKGDEKEQRIRKLLSDLEEARANSDPDEFDKIMGPDKQQLELALAKGLKEGFTEAPRDPNSVRR